MKRIFAKRFFLPIFLVVTYLLGLFLGACVVVSYPVYLKQREFFMSHTQTMAQEYLSGETRALDAITSPNTRILFYNANGKCIKHVEPTNLKPGTTPDISMEKYLASVLSGRKLYRPVLSRETQRELPDIMVLTGIPIIDHGTVVGAVFLIKNLMDLPAALSGYAIYFTIFYWLSAIVIAANIRKSIKLDKLQQTYIANVTHALKTPVASIKALSETLCDGVEPDPNQQKLYYGMILQEANRQDHMIRDILELSKLQSEGMDFTKTKLHAVEILDPLQDKYTTLCDCMDISLHISDVFSQLSTLYTNAACIRQILEILLDNALKFVSEGGNIWVEAAVSGKVVTFCVRDDGIGIEKEALPQVFDRFYKYSHDFNVSGSGLGLAIAKEITAGLKERIWVESEAGKGAAFFFTVHLK